MFKILTTTAAIACFPLAAHALTVGVEFNFDDYPSDISFEIQDSNGIQVADGGNYNNADFAGKTIVETLEIGGPGTYDFIISDSYGDGLCCNEGVGNYALYQGTTLLYQSNGQFGSGDTVSFTLVQPAAVPLPATLPALMVAMGGLGVIRKRRAARD